MNTVIIKGTISNAFFNKTREDKVYYLGTIKHEEEFNFGGKEVTTTTFLDIAIWNEQVFNASWSYLYPGAEVILTGKIRSTKKRKQVVPAEGEKVYGEVYVPELRITEVTGLSPAKDWMEENKQTLSKFKGA